jgi:glutathione synthase/RimK-type ligase-like ATP-grasp enzyme
MKCLRAACERLGISYSIHDDHGNFLRIDSGVPKYFVNYGTPFNDDAISKICKDKEFTYRLLKDAVRMPVTKAYFDPQFGRKEYEKYVREESVQIITDDILKSFALPMIVKMNAGTRGTNVFLCHDEAQVANAVREIYRKDSSDYDYMALAQDYVRIKKEYRVVVFKQEIVLVYEKDFSGARFVGNLSPLHQENAKAVLVTDDSLIRALSEFIQPIFGLLDVEFAGLDILLDEDDQFVLLELNSKPGFSYFVRDNGEEPLVKMYERVLQGIQARSSHPN